MAQTKRLPVIRNADGANVCQRCLVKWARVHVSGYVYCVRCGNAEREKQADLEMRAAKEAK